MWSKREYATDERERVMRTWECGMGWNGIEWCDIKWKLKSSRHYFVYTLLVLPFKWKIIILIVKQRKTGREGGREKGRGDYSKESEKTPDSTCMV